MTCRDVSDLLLEHRSGGLPLRLLAVLKLHTALCPCCRAMIATYGRTVELGGALAATEVPEAVARDIERVMQGLA